MMIPSCAPDDNLHQLLICVEQEVKFVEFNMGVYFAM